MDIDTNMLVQGKPGRRPPATPPTAGSPSSKVTSRISGKSQKRNPHANSAIGLLVAFVLAVGLSSTLLIAGCSPTNPASTSGTSGLAADSAQSTGNTGSSSPEKIGVAAQVVVEVDIDCSEAVEAGNETARAIAPDGKLFVGQVAIPEGQSLYEALKATGLEVITKDFANGVFVDSIQGLGSGATGATSGWLFYINGQAAQYSVSDIVAQDGDLLTFTFVNEA
ncbi:MAG: DUF4430 domain-containing protein [Coriobacteriales bacterium]|nr:DUF4430 domain-containing protein [Coriobacteriales bacterium]